MTVIRTVREVGDQVIEVVSWPVCVIQAVQDLGRSLFRWSFLLGLLRSFLLDQTRPKALDFSRDQKWLLHVPKGKQSRLRGRKDHGKLARTNIFKLGAKVTFSGSPLSRLQIISMLLVWGCGL